MVYGIYLNDLYKIYLKYFKVKATQCIKVKYLRVAIDNFPNDK